MPEPIVSFYDVDDLNELDDENPDNIGVVNAGSTSAPAQINIWNNKDGTGNVSKMENVRITTVTMNGLSEGDTVVNGKEIVEDQIIAVKSLTLGEEVFTNIGGVNTKTLADIRGDQLATPGQPSGTVVDDVGSSLPIGSYYYRISALDETGETLAGTESSEVVVGAVDKAVDLSWDAVEGASSYKIFRTTTSGVYGSTSLLATVETNSFTDNLASPDTGEPLSEATVTYGHKHEIQRRAEVSTTASAGPMNWKYRVMYSYV